MALTASSVRSRGLMSVNLYSSLRVVGIRRLGSAFHVESRRACKLHAAARQEHGWSTLRPEVAPVHRVL